MTLDLLRTLQLILGIAIALLTILGTIFGWFSKFWQWLNRSAVTDIPKKTIVLLTKPSRRPFWWHMSADLSGQPAMQIYGYLQVTNICKHDIVLSGAKLKKPKVLGRVDVKNVNSGDYGSDMVPAGGVTDLTFQLWVMPPVREKGQVFKADIAILDQFGNEHWVKE
jgi:hypothetical protein